MKIKSTIKAIRLSWREHRGVQLATLTVLAATFTVVISFLSFTFNLRDILHSWGDSVQMTAYLKEEMPEQESTAVGEAIKNLTEFKEVSFVSKEEARTRFTKQMANFAPGLPGDSGLENPFPASYQMTFSDQKTTEALGALAEQVGKITGVEEVSYGQDWIQNYASLVNAFKWSSWLITLVLILGSLFVVSNSIRASLDRRRDEIDIMKLVGASDSMIRTPFIFEGALMGGAAVILGLVISYGFFLWQRLIVGENLAFMNLASQLKFLDLPSISTIVLCGIFIGALGSYSCVFRIKSSTMPGSDE